MDRRLFLSLMAGLPRRGRRWRGRLPVRRWRCAGCASSTAIPARHSMAPTATTTARSRGSSTSCAFSCAITIPAKRPRSMSGCIDFLADVLDSVGQSKATILSAYRTAETNAMLARTMFGVAEHSQHIVGRALDIRFDSKPLGGDDKGARDAARRRRVVPAFRLYPHRHRAGAELDSRRARARRAPGVRRPSLQDRRRRSGATRRPMAATDRDRSGWGCSASSPARNFSPAPEVCASARDGDADQLADAIGHAGGGEADQHLA